MVIALDEASSPSLGSGGGTHNRATAGREVGSQPAALELLLLSRKVAR